MGRIGTVNDTERAMANRPRSKTYDVLAVSSTVHKANADYLAGILRYASGRQDWRLWLLGRGGKFLFK